MSRQLAYLLAGCLAATAASADGNPRQSYRKLEYLAAKPVTAMDEMGAWLMRLTGHYTVEGMGTFIAVEPFKVEGSVNCVPVGAGPGIHCIFNICWLDQFEINLSPPTKEEEDDVARPRAATGPQAGTAGPPRGPRSPCSRCHSAR